MTAAARPWRMEPSGRRMRWSIRNGRRPATASSDAASMAQDSSRPEFWDTRYREHVTPWDAGGVPTDLRAFARTLAAGTRALIPGCGSGHEVIYMVESGLDVLAIDFSPQADRKSVV